MRTCKWHKCQEGEGGTPALFTPARTDQEFCCTKCRNARAAWRAARGSALVDLLLEGQWTKLKEHRTRLMEETDAT